MSRRRHHKTYVPDEPGFGMRAIARRARWVPERRHYWNEWQCPMHRRKR